MNENLSPNEMVHLAHDIEAFVLKTPTGTQDYYPAVTPGLGCINYLAGKIEHKVFNVDIHFFKDRFLLVDTGKSHHSGINNWDVYKKAVDGDKNTLNSLMEIKEITNCLISICEKQEWSQLPEIFQREVEQRKKLSEGFTSPEIEELQKLTLDAGASGFKICGAGGGGCVLVYLEPNKKKEIIKVVKESGYNPIEIQAWFGEEL